jgi:RNA polymerase sigma-70 factor (ECF subfamily)
MNTTDAPEADALPVAGEPFCTTRWTVVLAARGNSPGARAALSALCEAYYEPVLVYLRRALGDSTSARDAAHEFFADLLQGERLDAATPERGKFRAYLSGALKHFLANRRAYERRHRRAGDQQTLPLHPSIDDTPDFDPAADANSSPDVVFDRAWATTLLARALATLRAECEAEGKGAQFERLKPWLTGEAAHGEQVQMAQDLALEPNTFKSNVHRLKRRFRQLVKTEIASTLDPSADVAEEMRALFIALGG